MITKRIITQSKWCEHLAHEYHNQDSDTLMVVLGGQNYSIHKPLLHYSINLGVQAGIDVLGVNYGFLQNSGRVHFPEDIEILYEEVKSVITEVLEERHEHLIFVGKSLGTVLIKRLKTEFPKQTHKIIFLTPVSPAFDADDFSEKLIIMGTGDTHYDEKLLSKEEESVIIEFEGADHSLETGNVLADLELLEQVLGAISGYLEKDDPQK